jgi:hypothetical protein
VQKPSVRRIRCRLASTDLSVCGVSLRQYDAEFGQGELFEILEDDQSLPEDVVQVGNVV